jgi:GNAT superfamily N-acetyltransferase
MEHLTHGWETDLDAGDTLLRRFVLASADRSAALAELSGGRHTRTDAFAAADPASPVMFDNAAVLLQPPPYVDLAGAIEAILDFYPPERHFVLMSAFPTPDLAPFGLELMGHPPFMYRPAGGSAPPAPEGLTIREVRDAASLAEFVTTIVEAYPIPGAEGSALADPAVLGGSLRFFLGELDGRVVATAGARIGHGVNDVEWVSTRPEVRGRGIGAAVTWAATLADPALPAVLIASDDGQSVYEAMGYVKLLRLTLWHRPPPA